MGVACRFACDGALVAQLCGFAGRVRNVLSFQVASELQTVLDVALPDASQLALLVLACLWLDLGARAGGAGLGLGLLRDVAVIQLGQALMAGAGGLEAAAGGAGGAGAEPAALASLFLLRTCLLCLPAVAAAALARAAEGPLASTPQAANPAASKFAASTPSGPGPGPAARDAAALAAHLEQAATLYQYRYAAATRGLVLGAGLPGGGLAAGLLGAGAATAWARCGKRGGLRGLRLLAPLERVAHLVLVDLLLAALRAGVAGALLQRLALGVLVLVALDAAGAGAGGSAGAAAGSAGAGAGPAGAGAGPAAGGLLAEVRAFALWRVASDAVGGLGALDAALAGAGAVLAAAGAAALAQGAAAGAGGGPSGAPAGAWAGGGPSGAPAGAPSLAGTVAEVAATVATQTLIGRSTAVVGDTAVTRVLRVLLVATLLMFGERALLGAQKRLKT